MTDLQRNSSPAIDLDYFSENHTLVYTTQEILDLRKSFHKNNYILLNNLIPKEVCTKSLKVIKFVKPEVVTAHNFIINSFSNSSINDFFIKKLSSPLLIELLNELFDSKRNWYFKGSFKQIDPSNGQYLNWHTDNIDSRTVGLVIHLHEKMSSGGEFILEEREGGKVYLKSSELGVGNAILFKIGKDIGHRVTPFPKPEKRTVFSGWYSIK